VPVTVRLVEDCDADVWNAYVERCPEASNYHQYRWRGFFAVYFKKETYYLGAFDNNDLVGLLPLVRMTSRIFGDYLVSLPFVNYGGVLADNDHVVGLILSYATSLSAKLGVDHCELREYVTRDDLRQKTNKVSMRLKLPATADELSKDLGSKLRSQIRRSDRELPSVLRGGEELVDRFYSVFSQNMRDLGTPVYDKAMFVDILRRFPEQANIVVIEVDGKAAAAAFLVQHKGSMEVPWASTSRSYNRISLNMRLYWELLSFAIENEAQIFDFGRSTEGSGTYRFKKQWGAEPTQLVWNYWLGKNGEMPELNPDNRKYAMLIALWRRLPLPFANWLGPHVVKNLP